MEAAEGQPGLSGVEIAPGVRLREGALRFRFVRSSGPGGQNVNKVSTACELRIEMAELEAVLTPGAVARLKASLGSRLTAGGEVIFTSDEKRTQEQNRAAVLERLREFVVRAKVEPKRRKKTKPSYGAQQRRLQSKKRRSEIKSSRRSGFD